MEKAKIRPLAMPKPLNRSSQKLACVICVLDGTRHAKFCSDRFKGFCCPNTRLYRASEVTFFVRFFGKATPYTPERIFTQNTSNDVLPGKEVPFRGLDDYILYLDP